MKFRSQQRAQYRFAAFALAAFCCGVTTRAAEQTSLPTNAIAKPVAIPGVHNAFRVTERIFSGSQPEGAAAFAALAKLGVNTIVSVDGSVPDVETARKHGLRYVHLPYGYDGVPTNRIAQLSKLTREVSGPFFVHCHHGLHRGPSAVAIMCQASEGWSPAKAEAWMHEAGTAADYPGLYRAAREFKPPTAAQLAAVNNFPEITQPSSLVEAMVTMDEHFTWLKQSQKVGWKAPPGHADISPAQEATILGEQFRELARTDDTKRRPESYRATVTKAERAALALRTALRQPATTAEIESSFKQITQACAACHKQFRNQ